jgi:hypothetical protein
MTAGINLVNDATAYRPGDLVAGTVGWAFSAVPQNAVVRLLWRAEGKGSPDGRVVTTMQFEGFRAVDRREFRLSLPAMPYSFSGAVLGIVWQVEFVARLHRFRPEQVQAFRRITMSPTGDAIDPYRR